jgi:hypothetical protein
MKRLLVLLCFLSALSAVATVDAQDFFADFALVVQRPSYETFLTNLSDSPIRVDSYRITSESGSLSPGGWASLDSAGPETVATLGPEADQFDVVAGITPQNLMELNPVGSATWQPGQSWSIGFPFDSADPEFALDAVFRFSSPDGFTQVGGTVIEPYGLGQAVFLVVPDLAGDFNYDRAVNAADYVVLRKTGSLPDDYDTWRANFGATLDPPVGAALPSAASAAGESSAVPESSTLALAAVGILGFVFHHRRRFP